MILVSDKMPDTQAAASPAPAFGTVLMKRIISKLHLWLGLACGAVFVVLGLTGSALAWIHELDAALNPGLLHVAPPPGVERGARLAVSPQRVQQAFDRLAADRAYGRPSQLMIPAAAGDVFVAWYRRPAQDKGPFSLDVSRQVMLDPLTLQVVGERNWGEVGLSRPLLMPTLFHIHRYLVAGETGKLIVGSAGIALIVIALSGIVLWCPRPTWTALRQSLTIRHGGSWPRFNYSFHRAAGFVVAPLLLIQGFSGGYLNLPAVFGPAIKAVAPVTPSGKLANESGEAEPVDVAAAVERAKAAFPLARVSRVVIPARAGVPYEVRVRQPGEVRQGDGATRISIDSGSGEVLRVIDPMRGKAGDIFIGWLFPLHTGEAFGTAGRVLTTLLGLMPLAFFVTGLAVWLKRRAKQPKARSASLMPDSMEMT